MGGGDKTVGRTQIHRKGGVGLKVIGILMIIFGAILSAVGALGENTLLGAILTFGMNTMLIMIVGLVMLAAGIIFLILGSKKKRSDG
jgi:predicted phage tail protein